MGSCSTTESNVNIPAISNVNPEDWSRNDVIDWLSSICDGDLSALIDPFTRHQICGISFIKITNAELSHELEIKEFGLREQFIYERNKVLHNYQTSSSHSNALKTTNQRSDIADNAQDNIEVHTKQDSHEMVSLNVEPSNENPRPESISCSSLVPKLPIVSKPLVTYTSHQPVKYSPRNLHLKQYIPTKLNHYEWNYLHSFSRNKTKEITHIKYDISTDCYVLQQYKNHCYLFCNKLVIDGFANQTEKEISVIIPHEIRNICYEYYFEYEWHILQFAFDVSKLLSHMVVNNGTARPTLSRFPGNTNRFTGNALLNILYCSKFNKKYRLQQKTSVDMVNDYCNELIDYGFIQVVATKYLLYRDCEDIRNMLYSFDENKKEEFERYQEFIDSKLDRNAWTLGTIIEIFSCSLGGWQKGEIINIDPYHPKAHIVIEYGEKKRVLVGRYDDRMVKSTRKFLLNRDKWAVGVNVQVFDTRYHMWFPAQIISVNSEFETYYYNRTANHLSPLNNPLNKYKQRRKESEISFGVRYESMFGRQQSGNHRKWSANIRDAADSVIKTVKHCEIYNDINPKNMLWSAFIRQHSKSHHVIPADIVNLIHTFCEIFIVWKIEREKINTYLNKCSYKDIIIGPSFYIFDGICFQLTLCPKDGEESTMISHLDCVYFVCYLELKYIPDHIKTITFLLQFFCPQLQHDCRGTICYDVSNKCNINNAWSWGKKVLLFKNIEKQLAELASLNIECSIDVIQTEYKESYQVKNIVVVPQHINRQSMLIWNISPNLLNILKYSQNKRRYFSEGLWNNCWMLSCKPNGENDNVYLTLHLIRSPFNLKAVNASYELLVEANNILFHFNHQKNFKPEPHKFILDMKEGFDRSEERIYICTRKLLQTFTTLTFKVNININLRHIMLTIKQKI